jgi:nucleoside-diphosphate-sugar epimerase
MYIITGHSGFVGKNFLSKFRSDKEKIIILKKRFKKIENTNDKQIKIINFATKYLKKHSSKDIELILKANLLYPINVIEKINVKRKIIFFNICSYFQKSINQKNRGNFYSASKSALSLFLKYYKNKFNIKIYNIYIYDTFGLNDKRKKIFNEIINAYKNNKKLIIKNNNYEMAPIYIDDLVELLIKYINDKKRPKEIHCHQRKILSINKICKIATKSMSKLKLVFLKNKIKNKIYIKDNSGYWSPKIKVEDRLKFFFSHV